MSRSADDGRFIELMLVGLLIHIKRLISLAEQHQALSTEEQHHGGA